MKSTEKQEQEKLAAMSQINPFDYGYSPEAGVTIPAEVFMAMLEFTQVVAKNETKEQVEILSFPIDKGPSQDPQTHVVRILTSPIGKRSEDIFNMFMNIHFENIDKGLAVDRNAPKLDLGDVPTTMPSGELTAQGEDEVTG
jgi:hypothetical protein